MYLVHFRTLGYKVLHNTKKDQVSNYHPTKANDRTYEAFIDLH